jgi:TPR repeat protein
VATTSTSTEGTDIAPNKELFLHHLYAAVELEEPDALYCLADIYVQGQEGFEVDLVKGRELYERASAKGNLEVGVYFIC